MITTSRKKSNKFLKFLIQIKKVFQILKILLTDLRYYSIISVNRIQRKYLDQMNKILSLSKIFMILYQSVEYQSIQLLNHYCCMKFCPICFRMLLLENSVDGNRLICNECRYYYPLVKTHKKTIKYQTSVAVDVIDSNQDLSILPITQVICPKCSFTKAYFQQRQTRSADEAQTIFYTCYQCKYKWNQN